MVSYPPTDGDGEPLFGAQLYSVHTASVCIAVGHHAYHDPTSLDSAECPVMEGARSEKPDRAPIIRSAP